MTNIHASCVQLGRAGEAFGADRQGGILIVGESGAGKSDLALRLIAMGAVLVADDRVELFARDDALWARPPAKLAGLIEARGAGIVSLPFAPETRIALVIRLVPRDVVRRLPEPERYTPPAPLALAAGPPLLALAAFEASTPAKAVLAAAAFANTLFREESNPE